MAEKTQPSDRVLVSKAIRSLKESNGSTSVRIKKYLTENHSGRDITDPKNLKQYLNQAVERGVLLRLDGGRYKVKEAARRKSRSKSSAKRKSGSKRRSRSRKSRSKMPAKRSKRASGSKKGSKSGKRSKSKKSAEPADSSKIQMGSPRKSSKDRKPVAEGGVKT